MAEELSKAKLQEDASVATPNGGGNGADGPEPHPAAVDGPSRKAGPRALKGSVHDRRPNDSLGEVQIELDGKLWILKPSPWASQSIEAEFPFSLTRALTYASRGDLKLGELATIILEGMKATGDQEATYDGVVQLVWREGQGRVVAPVSLYLHNCLTGGRPPSKKKTPLTESHIGSG